MRELVKPDVPFLVSQDHRNSSAERSGANEAGGAVAKSARLDRAIAMREPTVLNSGEIRERDRVMIPAAGNPALIRTLDD